MANVTRSGRKLKDNDSNSRAKQIGDKDSSASGSMHSDTSGLRRSSRETPSKKPIASSPSSTRKSERIEKRTPPTPPSNKKSERGEKQTMSSPLGSEKGDNHHSSTSSGSRKSDKPSYLLDNKGEINEKRDKNDTDTKKGGEKDRRPIRIIIGKKRLDARSYRESLLKSQTKKTQQSDLAEKLKKHDDISQGDSEHKAASNSMEVVDVSGGILRTREEGGDNAGESSDRAPEASCSNLRNLGGERLEDNEEMESSHPRWKRKINLVSKCSYNFQQSSREVSVKEAVTNAENAQVNCSGRQSLLKVPMESVSEGRSILEDQCSGKAHTIGISNRKRKSQEQDADVSMMEANEQTYLSGVPVSSPPFESKRSSLLEHCDACSNGQRLDVLSEKCNMCFCKYKKNPGSCKNSIPEDGGELKTRTCVGLNEECCDDVQSKESPLVAQTDYGDNACVICKIGGKLLCCSGKGCKRHYHCCCLDPPLKATPLGAWHCFQCITRKIQFGVHSVSEGIEFICDVREEEVPDFEGNQKQKQYLVKYKGLAHVHNRWIPEDQLVLEVPSLVAKFEKNQVLNWKPEWTRPQRLVQKRLLMSPNKGSGSLVDCQYEWYVKWSGLGYEHATWELENASFLKSPEAIQLANDYESRIEKAIRLSDASTKKSLEERKLSSIEVSKLPTRNISGIDNDHLNFINKLREYWHKNQNVIVEDQERILKVVLFILSLQSDVCQPFLIITTSYAISAWEAELMHLAPFVNVVAYNGNKDVRESIRSLEFYADGDCIMLQVLLSTIDAVVEDLEALKLIRWEALIVDECQQSRVSRYFEQVKRLPSGFRILLLSGSIKESIAEYNNLLSFVDSKGDGHGDVSMKVDSSDTITKLKEKLARSVVCERKSDSSKFIEYWIPVRLSNVQLEQYCATLLSSADLLRSCSKNDPVGALRDILISVRKCCDHPYLVDQSLQTLLTKDLPEVAYLDVGVNASGKLQFLDKILSEIKRSELRVLILFQSIGGSGRNCIGDILDDFLRQRYGPDSYERVDSGLVNSKKQAALNMFNNKERGRFVFLIENRACFPSIKLSSVDMVILFDSDWNPLNDLRALQKITIDSQFKQLKVFRLYSSCTVEEKVLALAKQDMILDSNIQNISRSTSHTLLLWGASFLFRRLDEFHSGSTPCTGSKIEHTFLNDVVQEFRRQLPSDSEVEVAGNCKIILKAQQSGASYSKDIILVGEKEMQLSDEQLPHVSWTNLLDGRCPRWRCTSGPSQRVRRKVQYFDELQKKTPDNDEASKKRKKFSNDTNGSNTPTIHFDNKRKSVSIDKEEGSGTLTFNGSQNLLASTANADSANQPVSENLDDSQKNLHLSLKPVITNLCEILQLPDDVKSMAGNFLEYIINNHKVTREPVTIFQAFQISLCWSAASLLNYKVSHKNSLSLAKQHLDFQCKEEETQLIYSVLRTLRQKFSDQAKCGESISAENSSPRLKASQSTLDVQLHNQRSLQLGPSILKQTDDSENTSGSSKSESSLSVNQVRKAHSRRMRKLYQKQMEEFETFNKYREKEKADLEMKHQLESVIIGKIHSQSSVRFEKKKKIDEEFARKKEELNIQMEAKQKKLEAMQRQARDKEKKMNAHWLEEAKSGRSVATYATLPLCSSGFSVEIMEEVGEAAALSSEHTPMPSMSYLEKQDGDEVVSVLPAEVGEAASLSSEHIPMPSMLSFEKQDGDEVVSVLPAEAPAEPDKVDAISAADMESMQQTRPSDSDSGSASLQAAFLGQPLNQGQTVSSSQPSIPIAGLLDVEVSGSEMRRLSHVESQTRQLPTVHPLDDPQLPIQQSQTCMQTVGQEHTTVQVLEGPMPVEQQTSMPDQSALLPDNLLSFAACHVYQVPAPSEDQSQVPASACINHSGLPSDNHSDDVASQLSAPLTNSSTIQPLSGSVDTGTSQPTQVVVSSLLSTESRINQEPRNESVAHLEAQIQLPDPLLVDYHLRHTMSPTDGWNSSSSVSRPNPQQHRESSSSSRVNMGFSPARTPARPPFDPLQNELCRIRREEEQALKFHEDEKMRLSSECEKEIEEIRTKYNNKVQEAELEFGKKKKALETNYNIVFMNRILAEAFRLKCDARTTPSGQQQQQQQQGSPVVGSWASAAAAAAPVQMVHQPSALFSSNPVARIQFHPGPSGNHHPKTVTEMRAPAPHLQPFRPVVGQGSAPRPSVVRGAVEPQPGLPERMTQQLLVCLSDDD